MKSNLIKLTVFIMVGSLFLFSIVWIKGSGSSGLIGSVYPVYSEVQAESSTSGLGKSYWNNLYNALSRKFQELVTLFLEEQKKSSDDQNKESDTAPSPQPQQSSSTPLEDINPEQSSSGPPQENPETIGGGEDENGTQKNPHKLEPNQFKKICGSNTYVLSWRIGGVKKKDMQDPIGTFGKPTAGKKYWILPTCQELANCHCCCNTCTRQEWEFCPGDICFSKNSVCDGDPQCNPKCKCDLCKKTCKSYTEPTHEKAFNRDCCCNMEGCPKGEGCKIVIRDPGRTGVDFTSAMGKPEKYYKSGSLGYALFPNGNGPGDKRSKIIDDGSGDTTPKGWVMKLTGAPGQCCKIGDF